MTSMGGEEAHDPSTDIDRELGYYNRHVTLSVSIVSHWYLFRNHILMGNRLYFWYSVVRLLLSKQQLLFIDTGKSALA